MEGVRVPRQKRAQASWEKLLDAAEDLLADEGHTGFTAAALSKRSGISNGGIFWRVDSMDALFVAVHQRMIDRLAAEQDAVLADEAHWAGLALEAYVAEAVRVQAALFERHGALLRTMVLRTGSDPVAAERGAAAVRGGQRRPSSPTSAPALDRSRLRRAARGRRVDLPRGRSARSSPASPGPSSRAAPTSRGSASSPTCARWPRPTPRATRSTCATGGANRVPSRPRRVSGRLNGRVLILSWEYPPVVEGGLARHVRKLSEALVGQGVEVHVLTRGDRAAEVRNGVHVHRVPEPPFPRDLDRFLAWVKAMNADMRRAGARLAADLDVDLVHGHDWLVARAAAALADRLDVPYVTTIHATEHGRHQGWVDKPPQSTIHADRALDGPPRRRDHRLLALHARARRRHLRRRRVRHHRDPQRHRPRRPAAGRRPGRAARPVRAARRAPAAARRPARLREGLPVRAGGAAGRHGRACPTCASSSPAPAPTSRSCASRRPRWAWTRTAPSRAGSATTCCTRCIGSPT